MFKEGTWLLKKIFYIIGGWTNPFEKYYSSQNGNIPQVGEKIKMLETTTRSGLLHWVNEINIQIIAYIIYFYHDVILYSVYVCI